MIIVLLLLFQSLCLYCQRLVLHIHDRWINRHNARLLVEVAETVGDRKAQQHLQQQQSEQAKRQSKRRLFEPYLPLGTGTNAEACRFCANSPQGYCRHHFHLQELRVQKQQRQLQQGCHWPPLAANTNEEYRQLRRIKRELKRSLQRPQQSYPSYFPVVRGQQLLEEAEPEPELSSSHSSSTSGFVSLGSQSTTPSPGPPNDIVTSHL